MLKILIFLGSIAFVASIPASIVTFAHLNRFARFVSLNHPDIGKANVFMLDTLPSMSAEGKALGKKVRNWVIVTLALFGLFMLSGLVSSFLLPG